MLTPPLILLAAAAAVYVLASLALLVSQRFGLGIKLDEARVIDPLGPLGVRLVLLSELVTTVLLFVAVYWTPQASEGVVGLLFGGYVSLWLWLLAAVQPASSKLLAGLYGVFMGFFVAAAAVQTTANGPVWQHVFVWSHAAHRVFADGFYTYKMLRVHS